MRILKIHCFRFRPLHCLSLRHALRYYTNRIDTTLENYDVFLKQRILKL